MKLSSMVKMATTGGGSIPLPNFPTTSSYFSHDSRGRPSSSSLLPTVQVVNRIVISSRKTACFAVQGSSSSTVAAETKEKEAAAVAAPPAEEEAKAPAKPKAAAKAPAKPLPQMMDEDVIPSLKAILEAQDDISHLELSFGDNKLEGYFQKKGNPYSFWAFFPNGINGPKGFSLSSYGSTASNVEPFLVDEKKVTAKLLVFWVEKRLAAQGIIPVWRD